MSIRHYSSIVLAAAVFLILNPAPSNAQGEYAPYPFVNELVTDTGGFFHSLALDAKGNPHVAYWDATDGDQLGYAVRIDNVWIVEHPDPTTQGGDFAALALDAQGNPHISYYDFAKNTLRYATKSGGTWMSEAVDGLGGQHTSIVIDSQGRPHIAYYENTNNDLKYAVKNGIWNVQTVDDTNTVGLYTSIALETTDTPHILYWDLTENEIYHAWQYAGVWQITPVTSGGEAVEGPTAIEIDAQNIAHAFYLRQGPFFDVGMYGASFDYYSWYQRIAAGAGYGDLALDGEGNIHIVVAYGGVGYHVVVRGDSLQNTIFDIAGSVSNEVSLDVDPLGNPVVSYFNNAVDDIRLADARVRLASPTAGATWPVGSRQTISWIGAGLVDIYLSTDGGATYDMIAESEGGLSVDYGEHVFTVPHTPSRFCKVKIQRNSPLSVSVNDSLFTIETSIALLSFTISLDDGGSGIRIAWNTDPGPADLAGYRIDRKRGDADWTTIVTLTRETSLLDTDGAIGDRYRLFGVNGLGEEMLLGEESSGPQIPPRLAAWPQPYSGGELSISFATGSLGGVPMPTEVAVYDVAGRLVRLLVRDTYTSGVQLITWDGHDGSGEAVGSGVYFIRAASGPLKQSMKLVIVR